MLAKPKPDLEGTVLADCLKYLNKVDGIWAWRRSVGAARIGGRWMRYGQPGQADIQGIISVPLIVSPETGMGEREDTVGVHLEVEVKKRGEEPTPKQRAWLLAILHHGGVALWCTSDAELDYKLRKIFTDRGWSWPA